MTRRFDGKVALITGAGAGIGRTTALRLIEEGAQVVGVDINREALDETSALASDRFTAIVADLTDPETCRSVVETCVDRHSGLDVLGNIAGTARAEHFTDVTVEQYRKMMGINIDACFFLSQAAIPHLLRSNGNIVSISSTAGLIGQAYTATYCISKAAVIQLTRALAMEYLKSGIRINAIAPGGINTPLIQQFQIPQGVDVDLMKRFDPVRGVGEPEDVASLFAYVASDEARTIHGAVLSVDNGMTVG
jgi:meso-butanediol dehydrogenase/(S,S)-butanediol dehydrogenase/diacetyl reductase